MSLEIKFRAWDLERKCWVHWDDFAISPVTPGEQYKDGAYWESKGPDGDLSAMNDSKHIICQQWTGALDEKNREIYEDDILSWREDQGWEVGATVYGIYIVQWSEDKLRYVLFDPFSRDYWELDDTHFDEVIGNIHENANLLPKEEDDLPPVKLL